MSTIIISIAIRFRFLNLQFRYSCRNRCFWVKYFTMWGHLKNLFRMRTLKQQQFVWIEKEIKLKLWTLKNYYLLLFNMFSDKETTFNNLLPLKTTFNGFTFISEDQYRQVNGMDQVCYPITQIILFIGWK